MRCDGRTPCHRCETHKTACTYRDRIPRQPKTKVFLLDRIQLSNDYKTQYHKTSCPLLMFNAFQLPIQADTIPKEKEAYKWMKSLVDQHVLYAPWLKHCTHSQPITQALLAILLFQTSRQEEAEALYQKAHADFIKGCFPRESATPEHHLVELAVLMIHYQCMAKGEQQAYMTMRMALDLTQTRDLNDALLKTLEAWYVWLTFYLGKPYLAELDLGPCKTLFGEIQKWAFDVTETYIDFLKHVVSEKKLVEIKVFQDSFDALLRLKPPQKYATLLETPDRVIALYHGILQVQLFSSATEHCREILDLAQPLLSLPNIPHAAVQAVSLVTSYSNNHQLYTTLVDLLSTFACADPHLEHLLNELMPEFMVGQRRDVLFDDKRMRLENQESYYELLMAPERLPRLDPNWLPKTQWGPALQQREWNKFFVASEVQTLHYHPNMQDTKHPGLSDSSSSSPISTTSHYPEHTQNLVIWDFPDPEIFGQTQWIGKDSWTH